MLLKTFQAPSRAVYPKAHVMHRRFVCQYAVEYAAAADASSGQGIKVWEDWCRLEQSPLLDGIQVDVVQVFSDVPRHLSGCVPPTVSTGACG